MPDEGATGREGRVRRLGLETIPARSRLARWWSRWTTFEKREKTERRVRQRRTARWFDRWRRVVLRGGAEAPGILDDVEAVFGDEDPSPAERDQARHGLCHFLMQGQQEWRKDGGVVVEEWKPDPEVEPIMAMVRRAEKRRPTTVMEKHCDCRELAGTFWDLDDFKGLDPDLLDLLRECREAEERQLEHLAAVGEHIGFSIGPEGCDELEIPAERKREWVDGVRFETDPNVPHYSKGPYSNVYQSKETIRVACAEVIKLLKWLIPVTQIPWIESRTQIIVKNSVHEEGGKKYRTVVDQTDSGLNGAVDLWKVGLVTALEIVCGMGPGSWILKTDLRDCFYHWKLHPEMWCFMGVRHPLTGQSYVFPVLPMGFTLSPPLCCTFTQYVADIIQAEMRARWAGQPSTRRAFERVPRTATRKSEGVEPASDVYVDDFIHSLADPDWVAELIRVAEFVFDTLGLDEKKTKREGPSQRLAILGFLFDTIGRVLLIPADKLEELKILLRSVLDRTRRGQSVAHQELQSLVGKLQWSTSGLVLGRAYLRHVRKPVVAVLPFLKRRRDRERFCIPLHHFSKAAAELEWFLAAFEAGGGSQTFHVGRDGKFEVWRWHGAWGEQVPADVLQFASDASTYGGGFWAGTEFRTRVWDEEEKTYHINILECAMILHALQEMGEAWAGQKVLGWCDNSTTVAAVNSGRSRSNVLMQLVRRIRLLCVEHDIHLWLCHIPGEQNVVADGLSRGLLRRRVQDWETTAEVFGRWSRYAGGFDWDAFANPSGANAKVERFVSSVSPVDVCLFEGQRVWAFPPTHLAAQFTQEATTWGAALVVGIVPSDTPRGADWATLAVYQPSQSVFQRRCFGTVVRCRASGVRWDVIVLRHAQVPRTVASDQRRAPGDPTSTCSAPTFTAETPDSS